MGRSLFTRDPRDRRYQERLAGSTVASIVIHALLAALLFAVLASSSQQGTTENVQGGETVTIERRTPIVANQPAVASATLPVPHVPQIAPIRHAPLAQPQAQRLPQNRHELAREAPTAPPNPRPIPQQSLQPLPQPTQSIFEAQPRNELPTATVSVPTVAPVAVSLKTPPTAAPSPAPTRAPTAQPSPRPPVRAAATAKPATPAPPRPSAAPTAAAVAARATAAPSFSPAPAARVSAVPAPHAGVPSPRPTAATVLAKNAKTAASPGPKAGTSPGPRAGNGLRAKEAPARPIEVRPTPVPVSTPKPAPKPSQNDLNARLRALLPNGPVHPTSKQYTPQYSLRGRLDPTPPPEILAKTKYLYETHGTGNEARVRMWVIAARKEGPTTICTGWMVRYPVPERGGYADLPSNVHTGPANGTQISVGGGPGAQPPLSPFDAGIAPIVDGVVSQPCDGRLLAPYAASPAPSP